MKKILAGLLIGAMLTVPAYADVDYSEIFDGMTLEEMKDLYEETGRRIEALEKAYAKEGLNDDGTEKDSIWVVKYYVDEFKQPTDEGYISSSEVFEGTFDNTATTGSLLYVIPIFDNTAAFKLFEYGDNIVKGYHRDGTYYDVTILAPSEEKHNMTGVLYDGSDRIMLLDKYTEEFYGILNENGKVIISIVERDRPSTKYLFSISDSTGFDAVYKELFG